MPLNAGEAADFKITLIFSRKKEVQNEWNDMEF